MSEADTTRATLNSVEVVGGASYSIQERKTVIPPTMTYTVKSLGPSDPTITVALEGDWTITKGTMGESAKATKGQDR